MKEKKAGQRCDSYRDHRLRNGAERGRGGRCTPTVRLLHKTVRARPGQWQDIINIKLIRIIICVCVSLSWTWISFRGPRSDIHTGDHAPPCN